MVGHAQVLKRAYWRLFWGQALALVGTGVATVALALLAYELVGRDAAAVFGSLLALKMGTYVLLAPLAAALVRRLPRGPLLVTLDLARAALLMALPFVQTVAGLFLVVLAFQACSAVFVPTAQAITSDLLPDEEEYVEALARSRLAYELEAVASPAVAGLLLFVLEARLLFDVAAVAFVASAVLLASAGFRVAPEALREGPLGAAARGLRDFLAKPPLRGLAALNLAAALATAAVTVVTVHLVRADLAGSERMMTAALVAAGAGSVAGALLVPRLAERLELRAIMLAGGVLAGLALLAGALGPGFAGLLLLWLVLGLGGALAMTPAGMLLRGLAPRTGKLALYATQFALANAAAMLAYPAAGWLASGLGSSAALLALALLALAAVAAAALLWPRERATAGS